MTKTAITESIKERTMFVRYVGNRVCFTVDDSRFYMADIEECTPEEIDTCKAGGKDMPLSTGIHAIAR